MIAQKSTAAKSTKRAPSKSAANAPLSGIAKPAKNIYLTKLGFDDPKQALLCLPASFSDTRAPNQVIPDTPDEDRRLYCLRYSGLMRGYNRNKEECNLSDVRQWRFVFRLTITLKDSENNTVNFSVFGNPWPYRDLLEGELLHLVGRISFWGKFAEAQLQDVEIPPSYALGRIWVKYAGTPGRIAADKVTALVRSQIDNPDAYKYCATKLIGAIGAVDKDALEMAGASDLYDSFEDLINDLHNPKEIEDGLTAKMVSHKLAAIAIQASALRHNIRHPHPDAALSVDVKDIPILAKSQKEILTPSQLQVASDIAAKMRAPKPMNVLLSGDVGTGKTLTYLLPAVLAHQSGAKVCIIAPTSILADQIARQIIQRFSDHISGVERVLAGGKILNPSSILVGTSGLTSVASKAKYTPNLLICDEQHKLPTDVREKLVKPWTHTLEVSATPIPRSLASALFGGKEILNLRECPVQKKFNCIVGDVTMRPQFTAMIANSLRNGHRAAVIYPRVNPSAMKESADAESEAGYPQVCTPEAERASVLSGALALEKAFPGKVIAIHGGMKDEEIALAIEDVRSGKKPLVVSSIVIETGVDIPGITTMIVRDADYFGISQLHQLRGRLIRNGGEAWFGMMVNSIDALAPDTLSRLQAIEGSTDGYELAEKDLVIRGFGDMDGNNQSGSSDTVFRFVHMRPEDFLRKKLSKLTLIEADQAKADKAERAHNAPKLSAQARMFA